MNGQKVNFEGLPTHIAPSGWTVAMTHAGGPPKWTIKKMRPKRRQGEREVEGRMQSECQLSGQPKADSAIYRDDFEIADNSAKLR